MVISVWGSPSSGKTTFSIKLAKELASKKKNVIIIFADNNCPVIPTLIPCDKSNKSLGNILSDISLSREKILKNLWKIDKVNYIAITGYREFENIYSYPKFEVELINEYINKLNNMADYIIIDTSSYFVTDLLSTIALSISDKVFRLNTPSLKSMSYFNSNLQILNDNFDKENHINILSNFRENDPIDEIKDMLNIEGYFPYMEGLREQSICTELFFDLKTKDENILKNNMHKIISLIEPGSLIEANKCLNNNIFRKFKFKMGV